MFFFSTFPTFDKVKRLDKEFVGFDIDFLRPVPTVIQQSEFLWMDLGIFADLQWDYNISVTNDNLSLVKELLQKSYSISLT